MYGLSQSAFNSALYLNSDFKIRFYDLRYYTHATLLLKQGIHPKTVSEHFSYKDMFITLNRYSHVLPGMQVDAVKICSERPFG